MASGPGGVGFPPVVHAVRFYFRCAEMSVGQLFVHSSTGVSWNCQTKKTVTAISVTIIFLRASSVICDLQSLRLKAYVTLWQWLDDEATKIASGVSEYVSDCKSNNYPTIEGLAVHLGVWRSIFYDRADSKSDVYHPEFMTSLSN